MNAKEISDATLPTVTPADNDLMLIYDTSAGTTGKATIADIAPKVAENIDISTLPAVTPAADDVLMIGDTSAGTTGKATIAGIAPKVAENIDTEDLTSNVEVFSQEITISNMGIKVFKYGKVVTILFKDFSFSGTTTQQRVILKNLPVPKRAIYFSVSDRGLDFFLFHINESGYLREASDIPLQSGVVFGSCTYIV